MRAATQKERGRDRIPPSTIVSMMRRPRRPTRCDSGATRPTSPLAPTCLAGLRRGKPSDALAGTLGLRLRGPLLAACFLLRSRALLSRCGFSLGRRALARALAARRRGLAALLLLLRGRLFLAAELFFQVGGLHQLEERHLSRVAQPASQLQDSRVAAVPGLVPGRDRVEELPHVVLAVDVARHVAARRKIPALGEGDQALAHTAGLLRLGQRGLDPLVLNEARHEIPEQSAPVRVRAAELSMVFAMAHQAAAIFSPSFDFETSIPKLRPMPCRMSAISLSDFRPKFRYFSISPSDFVTRSPMVLMSAAFRQFEERTESSSSSTLRSSSVLMRRNSSSTSSSTSSTISSSKCTKRAK